MSRRTDHLTDSTKLRFLEDQFNKEKLLRINSYFQLKDDEDGAAAASVNKQYEVMRKKLQKTSWKPTQDQISLRNQHIPVNYRKHRLDYVATCLPPPPPPTAAAKSERTSRVEKCSLLPFMIPPDSDTTKKLYEGVSRDERGRFNYLRCRHKSSPDSRYRWPIVSSWEYGWNIQDVVRLEILPTSSHGKRNLVRDTFYSRNGVNSPDGNVITCFF